mgnify:CR=1 FL=1
MLHDLGEEFLLDIVFEESETKPASLTVGLFNSQTDTLQDGSDLADITSEPTGSAYARQTVTFGTDWSNQNNTGIWESILANKTFDVSDSDETVDSWFLVANFQSDGAGDSSANDHLIISGTLSRAFDLSGMVEFTINGSGVSLD